MGALPYCTPSMNLNNLWKLLPIVLHTRLLCGVMAFVHGDVLKTMYMPKAEQVFNHSHINIPQGLDLRVLLIPRQVNP